MKNISLIYPRKIDEVPVTRGMLMHTRGELKALIEASTHELKAEIHRLESEIYLLKAQIKEQKY